VQSIGRHWKRIADEVEFSSPRTTLELRLRCDCPEERNELAMLLEWEYIHVDQPLDGFLEVGFAAETGEDEELARVRAPDLGSSDDVIRRHQQASWRSVSHASPSCAQLAISGLSRRLCEPFAATGSA
jgi:hypothetical protein